MVDSRIYQPIALDVQANGSVVVLGSRLELPYRTVVARYLADGRPDLGFGTAGLTEADFGGSMAVDSDGRIILAQTISLPDQRGAIVLRRLRTNGEQDTSFGGGGIARVDPGDGSSLALGALESDEDRGIVVAGTVTAGGSASVGLWRLQPDGALDPSFDGDGEALLVPPDRVGPVVDLTVEDDGSIVVADSTLTLRDYDITLMRARANGTADAAFGVAGSAVIDTGTYDERARLWRDPQSRLVVAGTSCGRGFHVTCFAYARRFTADGTLERTFDLSDTVTPPFPERFEPTPDGGILLAGASNPGPPTIGDMAVTRLTPDWTLDASFGGDGLVTTDFALADEYGRFAQAQEDGRITLLGQTPGGIGLARYLVAPGPADADADGLEDIDDRCPHRFGLRHEGCPRIARRITIREEAPRIVGSLRSSAPPKAQQCVIQQRIRLYRRKPGKDQRLTTTTTGQRGQWRVHLPGRRHARIYAIAPRRTVATLGSCALARSRMLGND